MITLDDEFCGASGPIDAQSAEYEDAASVRHCRERFCSWIG